MKYGYHFENLIFKSGNKSRIMVMDDYKYRLIAQFLMSDIQGRDPQYVFNAIDDVLDGKSEYRRLVGNSCYVDIYKGMTKIEDMFSDDEDDKYCEIETTELRKFVEIWAHEIRRFYKNNEHLKDTK